MFELKVETREISIKADELITTGSVGIEVSFDFSTDWDGLSKVAVYTDGTVARDDVMIGRNTGEIPPECLTVAGRYLTVGVKGTNGAGTIVIPTVYCILGRIYEGAEAGGTPPTPPTPTEIEQILAAAQAAADAAESAEEIAQSVRDDADAGSFDGTDGVSPAVTITDIEGGHRVTITDAEHPQGQSFDVLDGQGGGGGTSDHRQLTNRDAADQHPMSAITGLVSALAGKQSTISDLATIRSGAAAGATAVQTETDPTVPAWAKQQTKPSYTKAEVGLGNVANERQYSAANPPPYPVASVNGKTGTVTLTAADLGLTTVFNLKGSKPTYTALPDTGNVIGDVWYVVDESVGYIWLNDGTTNRWEQLGLSVDLSNYVTTEALATALTGYVAKVAGKGLSTNDFTDSYKTKLDNAITSLAGYATEAWVEGKGYLTQHQSLAAYRTAAAQDVIDDGKLNKLQGVAHAGEFLVVGSDGNVTTRTLSAWEGGSY